MLFQPRCSAQGEKTFYPRISISCSGIFLALYNQNQCVTDISGYVSSRCDFSISLNKFIDGTSESIPQILLNCWFSSRYDSSSDMLTLPMFVSINFMCSLICFRCYNVMCRSMFQKLQKVCLSLNLLLPQFQATIMNLWMTMILASFHLKYLHNCN